MQVEATAIPAVKVVTPRRHGDGRGFFSEVYNKSAWEKAGLHFDFVQDNHSFSAAAGTLRGLHFQIPPFAQDKLARGPGPHPRRRRRHSPVLANWRRPLDSGKERLGCGGPGRRQQKGGAIQCRLKRLQSRR